MTKEPINWEPIRKDYVTGIMGDNKLKKFPTTDELSKIYPPSSGTIRNKASEEKWSEQKKAYKLKVTKKAIEKKCHVPSGMDPEEEEEAATYDAELIIQSKERLEKTGEDLRKAVQAQLDIAVNNPTSVNPYHLKMLGDALKSSSDVITSAQDEITERSKVDMTGVINTSVKTVENLFDEAERGNKNDTN